MQSYQIEVVCIIIAGRLGHDTDRFLHTKDLYGAHLRPILLVTMPEISLFSVNAILILSPADGNRILAK